MKLQAPTGRGAGHYTKPYNNIEYNKLYISIIYRDSIIISRSGATTVSRGAFMNRWAPRRERGAVLSKRGGIRYW